MSPIEPSFDRVILKADDPVETLKSGIIIPDLAQDKTKTAVVLDIGPDCHFFKIGDHVIHNKYAGTEIELDRVTYTIVAEMELLGRLHAIERPAAVAEVEGVAVLD